MTSPVVVPPLAGRVLGLGSNDFVIAEWQDTGAPPGPPRFIAPLHLHRSDDEAWYVLEGTLVTHAGSYGPGHFVWFPAGTEMEHGATAEKDVVVLFITNRKFDIEYISG